MPVIEIRKKPLSTPLWGAVFFLGMVIFAIVNGTFYTPGWMHSPTSAVPLSTNPSEFFGRLAYFLFAAILSVAVALLRFPQIEEPFARIRAWRQYQIKDADPNNLSGKEVFFMLLPMLAIFGSVALLVLTLKLIMD
jgi:hypothetical protein